MVEIHRKGRWEGSEYFHEADYVLATDYASIEARLASLDQKFMILQGSHDLLVKERDELKRRCDKILVAVAKEEGGNNHDFHPCNFVCREIRAIAEGGDNG